MPGDKKAAQAYIDLLDTQLNSVRSEPAGPPQQEDVRLDINEEITRKQRLENDNVEQNIRLKRIVLNRLFRFLAVETIVIFLFALLQGTRWLGFNLPEWSFNLLVSATIAQI